MKPAVRRSAATWPRLKVLRWCEKYARSLRRRHLPATGQRSRLLRDIQVQGSHRMPRDDAFHQSDALVASCIARHTAAQNGPAHVISFFMIDREAIKEELYRTTTITIPPIGWVEDFVKKKLSETNETDTTELGAEDQTASGIVSSTSAVFQHTEASNTVDSKNSESQQSTNPPLLQTEQASVQGAAMNAIGQAMLVGNVRRALS